MGFEDDFDLDSSFETDTPDPESIESAEKPKKLSRKELREAKKKNAEKSAELPKQKKGLFGRHERVDDSDEGLSDEHIFDPARSTMISTPRERGSRSDAPIRNSESEFSYLFDPADDNESEDYVYPEQSIYSDSDRARDLLAGLSYDESRDGDSADFDKYFDEHTETPVSKFVFKRRQPAAEVPSRDEPEPEEKPLPPVDPPEEKPAPLPVKPEPIQAPADDFLPDLRPGSVFSPREPEPVSPEPAHQPPLPHVDRHYDYDDDDENYRDSYRDEDDYYMQSDDSKQNQDYSPYGGLYPSYPVTQMPGTVGYPMIIPTNGQNQMGSMPFQPIPIPYPMPMPMPMPMYGQYPGYPPQYPYPQGYGGYPGYDDPYDDRSYGNRRAPRRDGRRRDDRRDYDRRDERRYADRYDERRDYDRRDDRYDERRDYDRRDERRYADRYDERRDYDRRDDRYDDRRRDYDRRDDRYDGRRDYDRRDGSYYREEPERASYPRPPYDAPYPPIDPLRPQASDDRQAEERRPSEPAVQPEPINTALDGTPSYAPSPLEGFDFSFRQPSAGGTQQDGTDSFSDGGFGDPGQDSGGADSGFGGFEPDGPSDDGNRFGGFGSDDAPDGFESDPSYTQDGGDDFGLGFGSGSVSPDRPPQQPDSEGDRPSGGRFKRRK